MKQSRNEILRVAQDFDNAIETREIKRILSYFSDDCRIELLGVTLTGMEGARKWLNWMFQNTAEITLEPITIMVNGNTFFEEFIVKATLNDGSKIESKQAEVLIFKDYKVRNLRLYFDRLDFAKVVARGFISRRIVRRLIQKSLEGLNA
ncbi:MAG: nuclear transport factor 2 family protein [Promethearchaeota archaeon]